jgi:hypothetical protein
MLAILYLLSFLDRRRDQNTYYKHHANAVHE